MEHKLQPQASMFEQECDPERKDERRLLELFGLMQESQAWQRYVPYALFLRFGL